MDRVMLTSPTSTLIKQDAPCEVAHAASRRIVLVQTQAEAAGAQEISRIVGEGLTERGYDVHHVFLFRRTGAFDHQPNTFFCAMERPTGPASLCAALWALVRHLRRLEPDAVLCFQHYGNVIGAVAARLAGVSAVIANRNSAKSLEPSWTRWLDLAFGTTGLFKRVVVNCKVVADEYRNFPQGYRARIRRIDHGFQPKRCALGKAEARRRLGLPGDIPLLGSVGRLHPSKSFDAAVRLLAGRDWHLALVGQGPERQRLIDLAQALGASGRLHLLGELPPQQIGTALRAIDAFVFPSRLETFGLAAVEAAAAGVPVVANGLDVLHEVLAVDGAPAALFVDTANESAFAQAVARVLGDEALRVELIARGPALAERYSLSDMVARYAALIEELRVEENEKLREVDC